MADLQKQSAKRIVEAITCQTAKARSGDEAITICEDVALDLLFSAFTAATLADELPVKGCEHGLLWCKLVDIPLDGFAGDFWVEFDEGH